MRLVFRYLKPYRWIVAFTILIRLTAILAELLIPYVLEYMIDEIAPRKNIEEVFLAGGVMLGLIIILMVANVGSNVLAARTAKMATHTMRKDLFKKSLMLSGKSFDSFTLPSITSRMTSDSYNVQDFFRMFQSYGIRATFLLIGGIALAMYMDRGLGMILLIIGILSVAALVLVSFKGIPLYSMVQGCIDEISLVLRENIIGIRVVKALSKEDYERAHFSRANDRMLAKDQKASLIMAMPAPVMTLFLNIGLVLCVWVGAVRVNAGLTQPGVILAFLTYFNIILMSALGLSRVLLMFSKCVASANRVGEIINMPEELVPILPEEAGHTDKDAFIIFDHVSFSYEGAAAVRKADANAKYEMPDKENTRENSARENALDDISFEMKKGSSLGIIGPTGCGKTTMINLLMRFYEASGGHIFVDGKDIRTYKLKDLREMFAAVFQNDQIFSETIAENIRFGTDISDEEMTMAAKDALADAFISDYEDGYEHMALAHGANFSGGQKQRIMIARALARRAEILILDDSSSALDYRTDALVRGNVKDKYHCTSIVIAQRVSSVMSLDKIIVMREGRIEGIGTHEYLMRTCPAYLDIYKTQMGEEEA